MRDGVPDALRASRSCGQALFPDGQPSSLSGGIRTLIKLKPRGRELKMMPVRLQSVLSFKAFQHSVWPLFSAALPYAALGLKRGARERPCGLSANHAPDRGLQPHRGRGDGQPCVSDLLMPESLREPEKTSLLCFHGTISIISNFKVFILP